MERDYFFDVSLVMLLAVTLVVRLFPEQSATVLYNISPLFLLALVVALVVRESLLLREGLQSLSRNWRITATVRFALMLLLCIASIVLTFK